MKVIFIFFLLISLLFSCHDKAIEIHIKSYKEIAACGTKDPLNDLQWLHQMILSSKTSQNFVERVYIFQYQGEDIIVVHYVVSGVLYNFYHCNGSKIEKIDPTMTNNINDSTMVYLFY